MSSRFLGAFVALFALVGASRAEAQLTVNMNNNNSSCVYIGMAVWGGVGMRPAVCWRDDSTASENLVPLRTTATSGPMNQNVVLNALGGADSIDFAASSNPAPAACDCGIGGNWEKIQFDGYYFDVNLGDGTDLINGPRDPGDSWLSGDAGADELYSWSSIGRLYGGAGDDELVMSASGSAVQLYGQSDNDCLQAGAVYGVLDCGSGTDRRYSGNTSPSPVSCENVEIQCCGFC
ncbi:MAG: hypothetical protein OHK0013_45790 [Sandaracinaceae bacterium]